MSAQQGSYNTYIGSRYVPIFDGQWDNTKTYEPLVIVEYKGNSYTSKTYVPIGADINNTDYWALTGNYNAQIEAYRQEVEQCKQQVTKYDQRITEAYNKAQTAQETAELAHEVSQSLFINVLYPPANLSPLINDNLTDNSPMLQAIIDFVKTNSLSAQIYFPVGDYRFSSTVYIPKNHLYFKGEERAGSRLILTDNTTLFYVGTNDNSELVNFVKFENFFFNTSVMEPTTSHNYITFKNVSYCEIVNCSLYNGSNYIILDTAQGTKMYDVHMNNEKSVANVIGVNIINRCVSSRFLRVTMNFILNSNCIGFNCRSWAQDLFFERTETTGCDWCFYIKNETSNAPGDIIIKNSILDNIKGYAILMQNMVGDGLYKNINIIDGLYAVPSANNTKLIRFDNVNNVMISNIGASNINNSDGTDCISLNNCKNINISSCNFVNLNRGIVGIDCDKITCENNIITSDNKDGNSCFLITNTAHSICNSNIFSGRYTTFVSADNKCSYCSLSNNIVYSHVGYAGALTFNATDSSNINNVVHRETA